MRILVPLSLPSPTRGEGLGNDRRASFSSEGGLRYTDWEQGLHFVAPQDLRRVQVGVSACGPVGMPDGSVPLSLPSPTRGEGLGNDRRARDRNEKGLRYTDWEQGLHFEAIEGGRRVQVGSVRLWRGWKAGRFCPPLPTLSHQGRGIGKTTGVQGSPGERDCGTQTGKRV